MHQSSPARNSFVPYCYIARRTTKAIRLFVLLMLFGFIKNAIAADITVTPGTDTLSAAIGSAANGDTLILQEGAYSTTSTPFTVNKSLTIRATNRFTEPLITSDLAINGAGITVTLQGLKFTQNVELREAAEINLLENHWAAGEILGSWYQSSEGDGSLVIIGNQLDSGRISEIRSDNAYIAGNILDQGYIETNVPAWIVGNQIVSSARSSVYTGIYASGSGETTRILGNRVHCHGNSYSIYCIYNQTSNATIAANVIEITSSNTSYYKHGILANNSSGFTEIFNNIIRDLLPGTSKPMRAMSVTTAGSRIAGNIITDMNNSASPLISLGGNVEFSNNLCFNNNSSCPGGDGSNLEVDPQFIDLVDYQLAGNSPAIDAGPTDYDLADLDRSRNDMGVYGGPWSIAQYDVQREPDNYAPYVYPLFKGGSVYADGSLDIQAIGVGRLR